MEGAPSDSFLVIQGDQGTAGIVSVYVGLAALFSWTRTVRAVLPVLVAGGVTRRAATGGLLLAAVALALVTTAVLTLVAVAGGALQRWVATVAPGRFEVATDDSAYASSLTFTLDAPEVYFNTAETLPWFVIAALGGALLSAAWYRWRAAGVVGVLLSVVAVWSSYAAVVSWSSVATANALSSAAGTPLVDLGVCVVVGAATWLVLRRVPLRPPARCTGASLREPRPTGRWWQRLRWSSGDLGRAPRRRASRRLPVRLTLAARAPRSTG